MIRLPTDVSTHPHCFVFLSSVIHAHLDELFPGMEIAGCYQFRVTRDSDLWVDEEEVDDLMNALKGELNAQLASGKAAHDAVVDSAASRLLPVAMAAE